ncbi:MAG: hypothetical protein ACOYYJ_01365 [Chloroflexota bacterium]
MAHSVILHISGEPSIIGEMEELPKPTDTLIIVSNPRQKDGKELHYIESNVVKVIWPIANVNLIEVIAGEEEDHIIGFVRE